MRFPSLVLAGAVSALMAAAPALRAQEAAAATEGAPEVALPAITVSTVEQRLMTERVIATGLVAPVEEVRVAPLIEGQPIEALLAEVGDSVEAGQVLAVLSRSSLDLQRAQAVASLAAAQATIAQAEAQLLEAESAAAEALRVADQTSRLRDQGSASQAAADTASANAVSATARVTVARQSLEAARAQLTLGQAQLANVELQLTRTEVTAPFAGKVVARNATVGAIATAAGATARWTCGPMWPRPISCVWPRDRPRGCAGLERRTGWRARCALSSRRSTPPRVWVGCASRSRRPSRCGRACSWRQRSSWPSAMPSRFPSRPLGRRAAMPR
jgi:multidrug efflux pump subunit AcrA (membrane-fusion protein)